MRIRSALLLVLAVAGLALAPRGEPSGPGTAPGPAASRSPAPAARDRVRAPVVAGAADSRPSPASEPTAAVAPEQARTPPGPGRHVVLTDLPARSGDPGDLARALLAEHRVALGLDRMPGTLVLAREFDSLSGRHVRFRQTLGGVPVFGSEVSAHVARDGRPLLVAADIFPLGGLDVSGVTPLVDAAAAVAEAVVIAGDEDDPEAPVDARNPVLTILPDGKRADLAWRVDVATPEQTLRVFVDARAGGALAVRDLRVAADGRALLYDPNPVNSESNGSFRDAGDRDTGGLTAARTLVTLPRLDGSGFLRGTWVDLTASPVNAFDTDLDWTSITRSHHVFEQLMSYFHIDRTQERLRALGLTNVNARRQEVDAHASSADQSFFDTLDGTINLGDGGVDDGEDGDVIVHEYGHAIQHDQVEEFGVTAEGGAMGEGFSDFLACMMHLSARPAWDPLFASWDGTALTHFSPPYLRRVNRNKTYPDDMTGQVHADGEIWSRFLWDLHLVVGRDDALRVVIESHFLLSPNSRMGIGTDAVLVTNTALRNGRNDATIRALAADRGLQFSVPPAPLPNEEASEDNDTQADAATLPPGVYERYLLADDDWFRLVIPPLRRLRIRTDFDPAGMDMALTVVDAAGLLVAEADEATGVEEVEVMAADAPRVVFLRCHHAEAVIPAAYDLTITDVDLEAFGPKQTIVRRIPAGDLFVFRVPIAPSKVAEGARLKVKTRRRRGAPTEARALRPGGDEWADWAATRKGRGAKVVIDLDEPGDWVFAVRPRKPKKGRYVLKVKIR